MTWFSNLNTIEWLIKIKGRLDQPDKARKRPSPLFAETDFAARFLGV
jgi:hypothetical protein